MPTITQITVSCGAGFNHPYEQYANFKPRVSITAEISPTDHAPTVTKYLQDLALTAVTEEKERILARLDREHDLHATRYDIDEIKSAIARAEGLVADPNREDGPALFYIGHGYNSTSGDLAEVLGKLRGELAAAEAKLAALQ